MYLSSRCKHETNCNENYEKLEVQLWEIIRMKVIFDRKIIIKHNDEAVITCKPFFSLRFDILIWWFLDSSETLMFQ